jgi:hypothetical protein
LALLGLDIVTSLTAKWHLSSGLTFFKLAFSCYLPLQFFNLPLVPGGRGSNPPTTPNPERWKHHNLTYAYTFFCVDILLLALLSEVSNHSRYCGKFSNLMRSGGYDIAYN